jgi:hypothetical protein
MMRSKSDLRTRLGRPHLVTSLENEDTVSVQIAAVLRPNDDPVLRHPKSGTVPRTHPTPATAPGGRLTPPTAPGARLTPPSIPGARLSPAGPLLTEVERGLQKAADDEAEKQGRNRRRMRRRAFAFGLAAAGVGALLGLGFGTLSERHKVALLALNGAGQLRAELAQVDQEVAKISEALGSALTALDAGRFPSAEASALRELEIPFDGSSLAGRGIGRFKPAALSLLFDYTALVAQAKAQQARLVGLITVSRASVEQAFAQKVTPEFKWAVFLQNESRGPVANLQRLPQPFPMNPAEAQPQLWPTEFQMNDAHGRVTLQRYLGGDPLIAGQSVQLIPVVPETQASVCPNDSALLLRREINQMQALLSGDPTPGHEVPSLSDRGKALASELSKIGQAQNVPNR